MVSTWRILRRLSLVPADKLVSAGQASSAGQCRAADGQRNDCAFALATTTRSSDRMFCLSPVSFAIVLVRRVSPAVTRFGAAVIRVGPAVTRVGWPAAACSVLQPQSLDDVTEPADDVTIVDWSTGAPSREKVNNPAAAAALGGSSPALPCGAVSRQASPAGRLGAAQPPPPLQRDPPWLDPAPTLEEGHHVLPP